MGAHVKRVGEAHKLNNEVESMLSFYNEHYDIIFRHMWHHGERMTLENERNKCCRFCQNCPPDVTFRNKAHAVPESLGNKGLISSYECDACNDLFGRTIENDLGEWALPMRTFTLIPGKNGIPKIKVGKDKNELIINCADKTINVRCHKGNQTVKVDESENLLVFRVPRGPYRPASVYKAFVKIALSLLPEDEIFAFRETLAWIRETECSTKMNMDQCFIQTEVYGPPHNDSLFAQILRRKTDCESVPYAFLIIAFGNFVFQVLIPSVEKDTCLRGSTINFPPFPTNGGIDPERYGRAVPKPIDMSNPEKISDVWEQAFKFSQLQSNEPRSDQYDMS